MIYPVDSAIHLLNNRDQVYTRAVNPSCLQILRIDGKGMINDVIMTTAHDIINCEKNCTKRYCWNCHIWPNWLSSHQPHYCLCYLQWHTGVCEEMFDVNSKITQTMQSIWKNFTVRKLSSTRNGKPWQLSARFQTLTWRLGEMVQNLESPGLSGRVDSPVYTVKPHFLDTCLIKTPNYYRQFALSLGKDSP